MKTHLRPRQGLRWLVLCTLLAVSAVAARPAVSAQPTEPAVPASLRRFLDQATVAVNTKRLASMTPFAQDRAASAFAWVADTTTRRWRSGLIDLAALIPPMPDTQRPTPRFLAVFYAWHTCQSDNDHIHPVIETEGGWRLGAEIPETETSGFRVRDHDLQLTLHPAEKRAQIRDVVRLAGTTMEPPAYGLLRLSSDFRLAALRQIEGETPTAIPYQQVGGVIAFAPLSGRGTAPITLAMRYSGVVNHQGSDYILKDEATLNSYWYPHIARLPATATIQVTAPPGWTPIAPGELIRREKDARGALTLTFRNEIPVCYYTVSAGRYAITTRKVKGRVLAAYLRAADPVRAKTLLDQLERALEFFETRFGPFPYSAYTLVETTGSFGGALESYSFATFGPGTLPFALAHEVAHTWWGGLVPCAYTQSMWNEAFAEYSDALFQRLGSEQSSDAAAQQRERMRQLRRRPDLARAFEGVPLSQAFNTSDDRHAAVGYGKGLLALQALEAELGLETLLRAMRAFLTTRPRGEAAEWSDFEAAVNQTTGQDYRWFFAQWVERPGLPKVRLANVTARREGEEIVVEGQIVQEGAPYRLTLPIVLETQGGPSQRETIETREAQTPFQLRVTGVPVRLLLDPEATLPLAAPSGAPPDTDATVYRF